MKQEILAKIMGIIAKTGERVVVIDPASGAPFVLLGLDEYEKIRITPTSGVNKPAFTTPMQNLTPQPPSGSIEPDLAIWQEAKKSSQDDWGGDEDKEEDRYYMEPTE